MTSVVEGWDPFAARPAATVAPDLPAVGTRTGPGRRYLGEVTPWRRSDAVVSGVLALIGVVGVGVCWNGASREAAFRDQVGWTVGAFLFLGLFVLGGVVWLLDGFRQVRHGVHELQRDMNLVYRLEEQTAAEALRGHHSGIGAPSGLDLVVGPGMQRAHRPDCLVARGKEIRALSPAERPSYPPCGLCM